MSKADELFDELGYEKIHDNKRRIVYKLCLNKIEFNLREQYIHCDLGLDMQELKAINEKVNDLRVVR